MHPWMIKKKISYEKHAPQARFSWKKMRRRQDLSNKMRRRPEFLTNSLWILCPVGAVCNLFSTNHSSESSSFNWLINLWPAYSTFVLPTAFYLWPIKFIINFGWYFLPLFKSSPQNMVKDRDTPAEGGEDWGRPQHIWTYTRDRTWPWWSWH